ncbi:SPFH domain-containing protein [Streptomyces sp. NPDC002514]|uniref:SPFH domain-containing protein n=1 Tax=Streptomyces sp. NPDC001270 TaxID=3364554 RepID=UPI00368B39C3
MRWLGAAAGLVGAVGATEFIQVIPQSSAAVVERFGRYSRTLHPGANFVIPFVDAIRNRVDLRLQTVPFPIRVLSARDGNEIALQVVLHYAITSPHTATYGIASYIQALDQHILYEISNAIAQLTTSDARTSLRQLSSQIREALDNDARAWGITVSWAGIMAGREALDGPQDDARPMTLIVQESAFNAMGDTVLSGDTYNSSGNTFSQQGPHNTQTNHAYGAQQAEQARAIAEEIVRLVRGEAERGTLEAGPEAVAQAQAIRAELDQAAEAQRPPDSGRFRTLGAGLLAALGAGAAITGSVTGMVEDIRRILWP